MIRIEKAGIGGKGPTDRRGKVPLGGGAGGEGEREKQAECKNLDGQPAHYVTSLRNSAANRDRVTSP